MKKMGESQIIDFFSTYLRDILREEYGKDAPYTLGNFSGSQDRKFADFFAGTKSHNILIEFKEAKKEHIAEQEKPLRKKLCLTLNNEVAAVSRLCHFIGWGKRQVHTEVELNVYIDLVCRLWSSDTHLCPPPGSRSRSIRIRVYKRCSWCGSPNLRGLYRASKQDRGRECGRPRRAISFNII